MKINIGKNFSDSLKPKELQDYGMALLVPFWNSLVPTLVGLNGWFGFITGYVVPLLIGLGIKQKAITIAALTLMVQHLIYHFGQPAMENTEKAEGLNNGNGIWSLDENKLRWVYDENSKTYVRNPNFGVGLSDEYVRYGELPAGARMENIGGENVVVYDNSKLNDYGKVVGKEIFLNDYFSDVNDLKVRKDFKNINQVI